MRKVLSLLVVLSAVSGCSLFRHAGSGGYSGSKSTAVWGNWRLTAPDSTSFTGASQVTLALQPGSFRLEADYPSGAPVVVAGTAALSDHGELTLVPEQGADDAARVHSPYFGNGRPIVLRASASGGTLVFAPGNSSVPTPSSIWYKSDAAVAAGMAPQP